MINIKACISEGEHKTQEFKAQYSKTMLKTVSAFANYHDGRILVGISDQGNVIGIKNVSEERLKIENAINDGVRPKPFYEVEVTNLEGVKVIVYTIYKGDRTPYTYNQKAYERMDTSSVEVDRERYDELVLLGRNSNYEELEYMGELEFKILGDALKSSLEISSVDINILKSLGLYRNKSYNNAASWIADKGQDESIGLHLICYKDQSMTEIIDRKSISKTSILKHFNESMNFYDRYIRQKDLIKGERRITYEEVPRVAFREAVINAIVHRDYRKKAFSRIEFFPDRIEILSVGGLPVGTTEEEYLRGRFSNLRNPIVADLFFRLGYIEKMGTGIRRIKQSYRDSEIKPVFHVMKNSIHITLPIMEGFVDVRSETDNGSRQEDIRLSHEEERIINFFAAEGIMTRMDIENRMHVGKTKAVELLNELIEKGYIKKTGKGRRVKYERIEKE